MNTIPLSLLCALLLTLSLQAKAKVSTPLFWSVKAEHNTVYLLGSIHVGRSSLYPLAPSIEKAFHNSKTVVVEVNTEEVDPEAIVPYVQLPKGASLTDIYSDSLIKELGKVAQKFQIPYSHLQHKQPWFFMQYLLTQSLGQWGYTSNYGTETYLLVQKGTKKVDELESVTAQMEMLTTLFTPEYFAASLDEINGIKRDIKKLTKAWRRGDSTLLHALIIDSTMASLPAHSPVMEELFYKRNRAMTKKIIPYLSQKEDVFIIIGTGHFLGDKGIIALLKKQGYTITPVEEGSHEE